MCDNICDQKRYFFHYAATTLENLTRLNHQTGFRNILKEFNFTSGRLH